MRLTKLCLALIFSAFCAIAAHGQTRHGYDVLGLAMYCERFLQAPALPAVSTLLNTFGNPLPCIERRIERGGLEVVQIDLRDATCFRNRVCPAGTPPLTDWRVLRERTRDVNALAVKYPAIEWWVSPFLEHDIKEAATIRRACQVVTNNCPTCRCINSPFSGVRVPGIPLELHGTKVSAFAVSGDGASMFDADNVRTDGNNFEHKVSGSNQTYAWWNELNLRCTGEKKFTPPTKRTERPTADQFRQAYLIMQPEPPVPTVPVVCKRVRRVNGRQGEILKPNAESYCNGQQTDRRGNKPLLILRHAGKRGQKIPVLNSGGKEVGCFQYWGTFETPGTHRWYMGDCSGQTPAKLYDDLESEWGWAHLGGGSCIEINAVRRMGVYR